MNLLYEGKASVDSMFNCQMCGGLSREQYIATPSIPSISNWSKMSLCKKCAQREIGSKNIKKWKEIHEK